MSAVISAVARRQAPGAEEYWSVGQLVSIHCKSVRVVGVLYQIDAVSRDWDLENDNTLHIHVELVGEVYDDDDGLPRFNAGLSAYPHLGAVCHRIRHDDLASIFHNDEGKVVSVGALSQNRDIPALISLDNMIARHFAVVGTTGVGKSTAVSLLIRKILDARHDLRVLILDPHNEFEHALPDKSVTIDEKTLDLPFWLFTIEELSAALFGGRTPIPEEIDILRDAIIAAKTSFKFGEATTVARNKKSSQITSDTPIPYRFSDLLKVLDERIGLLDSKNDRLHIRSLMNRLQSVANDPRYTFMFNAKTISDNIDAVLSNLFRIPANGRPVAIMQLAGIPSEVVSSTVSVLVRLAFDLAVWSQSRIKTLVVCEEAHRYIPADPNAGFQPTRMAIARVAKEGRKYGVSLAVITQRPSELDPTILSQCNTFFAMRLGNEVDQEIVRKAIPGGARSFVNFVPSLANRESIAFGQGASTPMRLIFDEVPRQYLPGNENLHITIEERADACFADLKDAVANMRGTSAKHTSTVMAETEEGNREALPVIDTQRPSIETPEHPAQRAMTQPGFSHPSSLRRPATTLTGSQPEPTSPRPLFSGFGNRTKT
ncbi:MAG: DUF87 domain-containing protein [Ahrensia sp.]